MGIRMHVYLVIQSFPTLCDPLDHSPSDFSVHGIFQARMNTRVGCHFLLQGIFPAQGLNPHLLCLCITGGFFSH